MFRKRMNSIDNKKKEVKIKRILGDKEQQCVNDSKIGGRRGKRGRIRKKRAKQGEETLP